MARATRSSANADKHDDKPQPKPATTTTKKRKRNSDTEPDDLPALKQIRVSEQNSQFNGSGSLPLPCEKANQILNILDAFDEFGTLDRIFPVALDSSQINQTRISLRELLSNSLHPLSVTKSLIQQLPPVAESSRAPSTSLARKHLLFRKLAFYLVDLATTGSQIPPDLDTILPSLEQPNEADQKTPTSFSPGQLQYALVQHLPQGDYWTSSSSSVQPGIQTAHAELVAILPTPRVKPEPTEIPTLSSYQRRPPAPPPLPEHRKVSSGTFLEYGPWASFAPTFDQETVEVGRWQLGEVLLNREVKRRNLDRETGVTRQTTTRTPSPQPEDVEMGDEATEVTGAGELASELGNILSESDIESLLAALGSIELEKSVQALLEKNRTALRRLNELQRERLCQANSGFPIEGSEEWDTAQEIYNSLTILTSLRPRSSEDYLAFIPPPQVLRSLHRALPRAPGQGWYGRLPDGQKAGFRDNGTIKIRAGINPATAPTAVAAAPTPTAASTGASYAPYPYAYAPHTTNQASYRGTGGTPTPSYSSQYKPTGTSSYYQNAAAASQTAYATQPYAAPATGTQSYSTFGTAWYGNYQAASNALPATYGTFFNTQTSTARSPAVANTVVAKNTQWNPGQTAVPVLPPRVGQQAYYYQPTT